MRKRAEDPPVLVVGADERVSLGVAAPHLGALYGVDGDERELVESLHHPLDQRQQVAAVLVELENRLLRRGMTVVRPRD